MSKLRVGYSTDSRCQTCSSVFGLEGYLTKLPLLRCRKTDDQLKINKKNNTFHFDLEEGVGNGVGNVGKCVGNGVVMNVKRMTLMSVILLISTFVDIQS